jgi:hypothetical protein
MMFKKMPSQASQPLPLFNEEPSPHLGKSSSTNIRHNDSHIQSNENLRVVIRVRPPLAREIKDGKVISTV